MGVTVSSSLIVSATPPYSGGGFLILCPCSSVRSLSWETVLHKLLQPEFFPRAAVLQEQAVPVWVPDGVTSPASKPAPACAPLSMGPQVLAGACSSTGPPTGSQLPSGIHLLQHWVPSMGYRWRSDPLWTSTGCLTMVFITSCQGRLSALASRAPPPPPSSLTLVPAGLFLSHSLTPLSAAISPQLFLPLLKSVIPKVLPPSLMALALARGGSVLELAGTGSVRHGGSFEQLLTEGTPIAHPLPKPCHANQ